MTPWSSAPPPQNVHDAIDQAVECTLAAVDRRVEPSVLLSDVHQYATLPRL